MSEWKGQIHFYEENYFCPSNQQSEGQGVPLEIVIFFYS